MLESVWQLLYDGEGPLLLIHQLCKYLLESGIDGGSKVTKEVVDVFSGVVDIGLHMALQLLNLGYVSRVVLLGLLLAVDEAVDVGVEFFEGVAFVAGVIEALFAGKLVVLAIWSQTDLASDVVLV